MTNDTESTQRIVFWFVLFWSSEIAIDISTFDIQAYQRYQFAPNVYECIPKQTKCVQISEQKFEFVLNSFILIIAI